jgi:hypothetical protein
VDDPGKAPILGTLTVKQPGRYQVWLEVSLTKRFVVWVGRQLVGSVANQLGPPGQFVRVGEATLAAGIQPIKIEPAGSALAPGDGTPQLLGPLMLAPDTDPPAVSQIDARNARSLCGQSLDWLEIVR